MGTIAEVQRLSESAILDGSDEPSEEASLDTVRISRHFDYLAVQPHRVVTLCCTSCGKTYQHELDCGDRLCPRCNASRRGRIMRRYLPIVRSMSHPKFLTLTVRRKSVTRHNVTKLRDDFTRLRHRKIWKASGGIYQIELGTIDDLGMANLHIHAIVNSDWIGHDALSDAWLDITGDSYVIDIREAKGDRALINYMTKHLVKVTDNTPTWAHDLVNDVLGNTRLVQGFGDLTRLGLSVHDSVCPFCHAVNSIIVLDYEPCHDDFSGVFDVG